MMDDDLVKALAQLQRDMDSGAIPYVMFVGNRMAMHQEVMEQCGLVVGQTIDWDLFGEITKRNIALLEMEVALIKAGEAS